jgi:5-methylcytosine-specific restriction enzyme B
MPKAAFKLVQMPPKKRCNSANYLAVMDALEPRFEEAFYPVHSYSELSLEARQYKSPSNEASSTEIDSLPEDQEDEDGVQKGG